MKTIIIVLITIAYITLFIPKNAFSQETGSFEDNRDQKVYKTIKLNSQLWMAENLAFKADSGCWAYDTDTNNVAKYGYLYNWETANKVCPTGWRLPTLTDFETLLKNAGGEGNPAFSSLIIGGSSGFDAYFGGWSYAKNGFMELGELGNYWSSSLFTEKYVRDLHIGKNHKRAIMATATKNIAYSVRCIKND